MFRFVSDTRTIAAKEKFEGPAKKVRKASESFGNKRLSKPNISSKFDKSNGSNVPSNGFNNENNPSRNDSRGRSRSRSNGRSRDHSSSSSSSSGRSSNSGSSSSSSDIENESGNENTNRRSSDNDDVNSLSENESVAPKLSAKRCKAKNPVERRLMGYKDKPSHIVSMKADKFFELREDKLMEEIRIMNHATRYWLAVKFCRLDKKDFQRGAALTRRYSKRKTCRLLGVTYGSIYKFLNSKMKQTDSIADVLKKYKYLSPAEFKPNYNQHHIRESGHTTHVKITKSGL